MNDTWISEGEYFVNIHTSERLHEDVFYDLWNNY